MQEDIPKLAQDVGFKKVNEDDVGLFQSHLEPLSIKDLMATEQERAAAKEC
jgi:hypothetical protein